jgi:CheY-like chemotaxis protein
MPDLAGAEVLRRANAEPALRGLPVLMLTAKTEALDHDEASLCGPPHRFVI